MVEGDKRRFLDVLRWLCRKYPVEGRPRPLPQGEDLREYFAALRDIPIEDLEGGSRWHYGHSEFYPDRPATLRKSAEEWRRANPRQYQAPVPWQRLVTVEDTPESREHGARALQRVLDALSRGESPRVMTVSDLVGEV